MATIPRPDPVSVLAQTEIILDVLTWLNTAFLNEEPALSGDLAPLSFERLSVAGGPNKRHDILELGKINRETKPEAWSSVVGRLKIPLRSVRCNDLLGRRRRSRDSRIPILSLSDTSGSEANFRLIVALVYQPSGSNSPTMLPIRFEGPEGGGDGKSNHGFYHLQYSPEDAWPPLLNALPTHEPCYALDAWDDLSLLASMLLSLYGLEVFKAMNADATGSGFRRLLPTLEAMAFFPTGRSYIGIPDNAGSSVKEGEGATGRSART